MSDYLDRYDVEAMIRDARHEIRAETDRAVSALRDDLRDSTADLRAAVAELREQVAAALVEGGTLA